MLSPYSWIWRQQCYYRLPCAWSVQYQEHKFSPVPWWICSTSSLPHPHIPLTFMTSACSTAHLSSCKIHQVWPRWKKNLPDFPACSLTFPDSLSLTPPKTLIQTSWFHHHCTVSISRTEFSHPTNWRESSAGSSDTSTITRNWIKNAAAMGSSTTQGSVYKHRQKLRIEEKVFCPHSCTAMVVSYIISLYY